MNAKFTCEDVARSALGAPVRREGAELLYRCAQSERHSNGDAHPSLKINTKKNVWSCFPCAAKGTAWALAAFLARLDPEDKSELGAWLKERGLLNGAKRSSKKGTDRKLVATYTYTNPDGGFVARKLRFEPGRDGQKKDFAWQRWENASWVDGLAGVKTPLYRCHEIQNEQAIAYFEGEKAADAGVKLGLATTTAGGVNNFRPDHAEVLRGKDVVIFPDNDRPGREHAQRVAAALHGLAKSIRIVVLQGLPEKGDLYDFVEGGGTYEVLAEQVRSTPERTTNKISGAELLDRIAAFIQRFVALSEAQRIIITLWVVHTHLLSAIDCTAYLAITSAEKQSGKTRLLEVLETIVANPWLTGRVTAAVLIRKIDAAQPTLLLDESDAAFGGEREYAEALRGVLNTGYRRGGKASCCVGKGAETNFKDFSTFCAKAIAGIGKLPDTVADRSIPIRLKRAVREDSAIQRFRRRDIDAEASALHSHIESFALAIAPKVTEARPQLPDELTDRQQDAAEGLLAIADLAGGLWPAIARHALVQLCGEAQQADESVGQRLLYDIRQIFDEKDIDRTSSSELASCLAAIETSPWGEWTNGRAISPAKVARLLRPFGITSHSIRVDDRTPKGYEREDFEDAWKRYLGPSQTHPFSSSRIFAATTPQASADAGFCSSSEPHGHESVAPPEYQIPANNEPCGGVALSAVQIRNRENGIEETL
jgi:hypothetical protein